MNKFSNASGAKPLSEGEIIYNFEEARANNKIEGIHVSDEDHEFILDLALQGISPDEMVLSMKKRLFAEFNAPAV